MLIDWGMGLNAQEDLLRVSAEYIDLAKIAVGISGLLYEDELRQKINHYRNYGVQPFPGGQYLEYAVYIKKADQYLEAAKQAGYTLIEVSDNTVPFDEKFKSDLIARARDDYGFTVLGEVGSKLSHTNVSAMIKDVEACLTAGAWKVFVEAAELVDASGLCLGTIEALKNELPVERLIFELPGWWLGKEGENKVSAMRDLLQTFGADVNLANVCEDEVLFLETLRLNTGVAGFSQSKKH